VPNGREKTKDSDRNVSKVKGWIFREDEKKGGEQRGGDEFVEQVPRGC